MYYYFIKIHYKKGVNTYYVVNEHIDNLRCSLKLQMITTTDLLVAKLLNLYRQRIKF